MQAFVPKNRRPKFELTLRIIDLSNIPLATGTCYIKWHLPSSTAAEHRGRTEKAIIKEHKAVFEYVKKLEVRLTIDRNQVLQESDIVFEVLQEYSVGVRGDRIVLGNIKLNLSEYVNKRDENDVTSGAGGANSRENAEEGYGTHGVTRRYLMQDSKVNSTLKVSMRMRHLEGDKNFAAPPLKSAMVFGGIAGIMNAEQGDSADNDSNGHIPSLTSKTRDLSELQDMYRRTLAAAWSCSAGELAPDRLVEDIFAGGDGGNMLPPPNPFNPRHRSRNRHSDEDRDDDGASISDSESHLTIRGPSHSHSHSHSQSYSHSHKRSTSSQFLSPSTAATSPHRRKHLDASLTFGHLFNSSHHRSPHTASKTVTNGAGSSGEGGSNGSSALDGPFGFNSSTSSSSSNLNLMSMSISGVSGRGSIEQQMRHHHEREQSKRHHRVGGSGGAGGRRGGGVQQQEVTEFDVREDLRSWCVEVRE
ncbi:MAG: hypothetical protein Q9160_005739 [Pyrenula sp. 1 TL-2023]